MTYNLIGLLISKVPTSVKEDLVMLNSFFEALVKVWMLFLDFRNSVFFYKLLYL